jgi:hypothetical protein
VVRESGRRPRRKGQRVSATGGVNRDDVTIQAYAEQSRQLVAVSTQPDQQEKEIADPYRPTAQVIADGLLRLLKELGIARVTPPPKWPWEIDDQDKQNETNNEG